MALVIGLLAPVALAAKSIEQIYVDSYRGRTDTPVPITVVSPKLSPEWVGRHVDLVFIVDANGRPRAIRSQSPANYDLEFQVKAAIRRWRFEPLRDEQGNPVPSRVELSVYVTKRGETSAVLHAAN